MSKKTENKFRRIFYANAIALSLIPCLVFAAFNLSPIVILNICLTAVVAALCELVLSHLKKTKYDPTVISLSLLSAIALPGDASAFVFILCGIVLYAFIEVFRYLRPYAGISLPALAFSFLTLFFTSHTSADSIVSGYMPDNIFVWNLLIGNYTLGMTICSSVVCLIVSVVILSVQGKIRISDMLVSAISFGFFISLLCEGNGITPLTMISFILLDGKIFFAISILAVLKGYSLPASSPMMSKLFIVTQSAIGAYFVCRGMTYGVYYAISIVSLFALTIEKFAYRKNIRLLLI